MPHVYHESSGASSFIPGNQENAGQSRADIFSHHEPSGFSCSHRNLRLNGCVCFGGVEEKALIT